MDEALMTLAGPSAARHNTTLRKEIPAHIKPQTDLDLKCWCGL